MPSYSKKAMCPGKSADELYAVVARDIDRLLEKTAVGEIEIKRDPSMKEVRVKSPMFSATLFCREGELNLEGQLSLLAFAFKPKIDEAIDRWLSKAFATTAKS